jgi:hypothetical protein
MRRAPHQKSFHMAAEKHVRIEFWNMVGGAMTSFTYQGDTVLTCYAGVFRLESSTETVKLGELGVLSLGGG